MDKYDNETRNTQKSFEGHLKSVSLSFHFNSHDFQLYFILAFHSSFSTLEINDNK